MIFINLASKNMEVETHLLCHTIKNLRNHERGKLTYLIDDRYVYMFFFLFFVVFLDLI